MQIILTMHLIGTKYKLKLQKKSPNTEKIGGCKKQ